MYQVELPPILVDVPSRIEEPDFVLRPYEPGDGALLYASVNNSRDHLARWLDWVDFHQSPMHSEALVRKTQGEFILRTSLVYGIFTPDETEMMGSVGFTEIDWDHRVLDLGYWLSLKFQGRGVITRACAHLMRIGMDLLGADSIEVVCDQENFASRRVPHRLGIPLLGTLGTQARYAITREEYAKRAA